MRVAVTGANGPYSEGALLRNRPLSLDEALDRFQAEWARRAP